MLVLGIMSGSSLDGFDLALCKFKVADELEWELLYAHCYDISEELTSALPNLYNQPLSSYLYIERKFNEALAEAIKAFNTQFNVTPDLVCTHGHTIVHLPEEGITLQLGNGGMLSSLSGFKVVSDLRIQDVSSEGVGTPLIPIAERDLFEGYDYYLNLGGIANLSNFTKEGIIAYDICPCNQVLNAFAERQGKTYDKDGLIARKGNLNHKLLSKCLEEEYLLQESPKSLDNNWIKNKWIPFLNSFELSDEDMLRSYVELIAVTIKKEIKNPNSSVFVSGGGVRNVFLMERIGELLKEDGVSMVIPDRNIIDFKEAILMAYMGFLRINEDINIINAVTGAKQQFSAGAVYLPPND